MSKRFSKQDKIDMLNYVINKDRMDGKRAGYTNISKAKISDIDNLLLKHNAIDLQEIWNELTKIKQERENEDMQLRIEVEQEMKLLKEQRLAEKQLEKNRFDELYEPVKLICERKHCYETYSRQIKRRWNEYKHAHYLISKSKKSPLNKVEVIGGKVTAIINGVHIIVENDIFIRDFRKVVWEQDYTKVIMDDWENGRFSVPFIKKKTKNAVV